MSRRRPQQSHGVQLFPFLDVLLSAMGALILLLAVASRNLSQQEAQLAAKLPVADELRVRREMVSWEIEQLRTQRDKTAADLANERLKLGHLEQHARQLRDEVNELARAEERLSQPPDEDESPAAELRELLSRIAAARHALEETLAKHAGAEPSYAIIPYQGPHETHRRPIYIECRGSEILLQPEGVVLTLNDLDGPLGPGNPLAAAVRAASEHLRQLRSSSADETGEPYPLLLVRPDGIEMFYAARAALDSWGSEFGYEFIERDWKIDYKQPDSELAAVEQDAVDSARQQQRLVAQLAPRIQRNGSARTYRAAKAGGGIVAEDDGDYFPSRSSGRSGGRFGSEDPYGTRGGFAARSRDEANPNGRWTTAAERAGGPEGGYSAGGNAVDLVEVGPGYGGGLPGDSSAQRESALTAPYRAALESARARDGWAADQRSADGHRSAGQAGGATGHDSAPLTTGAAAADATAGGATLGSASAVTTGVPHGAGADGHGSRGGVHPGSSRDGSPDRDGQGPSASENSPTTTNGHAGSTHGTQAPTGAGSPAGGANALGSAAAPDPLVTPGLASIGAQFGDQPQRPDQQPTSDPQRPGKNGPSNPFDTAGKPHGDYAQSRSGRGGLSGGGGRHTHRGNNWALPESAPSSVPLSRPIRVECHQDRITIYSDRGRGVASRVVEFGPHTEDSLNEFVSAVWDHMAGWGIAGDGFYWHPILNLHIAPSGDARASELKALLADSGLEIREPRGSSVRRPVQRETESIR